MTLILAGVVVAVLFGYLSGGSRVRVVRPLSAFAFANIRTRGFALILVGLALVS